MAVEEINKTLEEVATCESHSMIVDMCYRTAHEMTPKDKWSMSDAHTTIMHERHKLEVYRKVLESEMFNAQQKLSKGKKV